ncbi:hypothetical protein [Halomonas llamarensis]|uniref:Polysaccharide export protein n=1 Tax=Halomonas llamarensis TaxID=2945104 RepID=A0ABT0SUQ6_9GAMM|nr:hypothetical protein [Halomonas llamarensis]MCL7931569.1 hypothetical protein [Halomonas llamarensis]
MYRILMILCVFLVGCTSHLWKPETQKVMAVNGFYVNQETNGLVVTSSSDAYLFPSQERLGQALMLSRDVEFIPEFNNFALSRSNVVTGTVVLTLDEENPSDELVNQLSALGFEKNSETNRLVSVHKIRGERYTIQGELPLEKLENDYKIRISQPRGVVDTARKVVATPFAITFDAALTAVVFPVVVLGSVTTLIAGP